MSLFYARLKPDENFFAPWEGPDVPRPETPVIRALRSAGLLDAYLAGHTPGVDVGDFVLSPPRVVREIRDDESDSLVRARQAAIRSMERLDRFGLTGRLNSDDDEAEDRDVESGARLVLLRGSAPPRIEPHVEFEFVLRNGEVLHLQHTLRSVPKQMWAVVEVGALGNGNGTFFLDYRLVHAVPDVGPLRVGDHHPSLAKSVCSDSVCQFLLTALDISDERTVDSDAAISFLLRAHRHGLPLGSIPSPWVNEDGNYPKRGFAERLLAGMAPSRDHGGHGPGGAEPQRRLIKTFADAEQYASEYMCYLGFRDATPTPPGADGGVDVVSSDAIAQVKMEGIATGRPVVQAIAGIASLEGKRALVFSLAGYTTQALEWADRARVACLEFAVDGSVEPANESARLLANRSPA